MTDEEFRIRHGQLADAAILAYFGERCFRAAFEEDDSADDIESYLDEAFAADSVSAEFADPKAVFLLAHVGEDLVAYAKLLGRDDHPDGIPGKKPCELVRQYVDPDQLDQGYGTKMMDAILEEVRYQGYDSVWLVVRENSDEARKFYRRWEFSEVGSVPSKLGEDEPEDIVMARLLDD